ncbi:MAG: hypothetical protein P8I53_04515 [Flavobacteriaceae bacterium]|nr:hypothetical protein [Flavobacteriaceae bacterium]|tara:strand:+ start:760 stop:1191 length:432 start_codon:yes stop_codon:yes gene_type:complete
MKKLLFTLTVIMLSTFISYSQDLTNPQGGGTLQIESIIPGDGYSKMNFKGDISGYGKVFASIKLSSGDTSKTSGTLDGQARTILNNGTLLSSPLKGSWKREGSLIKFYFTDDVSNGAMNFVIWDVDILGETANVKYYELHSGN